MPWIGADRRGLFCVVVDWIAAVFIAVAIIAGVELH
jgi:hypothetical protein